MTEFSKSVKLQLDYTNWNAWKLLVLCALRVAGCAQYIHEDGGHAEELVNLLYERPFAPPVVAAAAGTVMTVMSAADTARPAKYEIDMEA